MARKSRYDPPVPSASTLSAAERVAGVYLRLSVEDGDDIEHNSIGNQRKICMAYLQARKELRFGGIYIDNGYSGMNYKRPGFQAMLQDLQAGKIDCVIVKDVSRLGRNYILTSEYVERTFPAMGARLVCVNDNYDSEDPGPDRDGLLMPFRLIMNDTYVKDTSRRIRASIGAKMRAGGFLPSAGSVPYGYLRDPDACTYQIDEETAHIVRRVFEMRASGMAFNAIARQLNLDGVPCPGKLRYDRGVTRAAKYQDALWIRGTIRKMTRDVVYVGSRVHGRTGRDRPGDAKRGYPEEQWQIIPNAHPPIVSQELFDRAREVDRAELERREGFEARADPQEDYRAVLRGKVFCGDCGARMSASKRVSRKNSGRPSTVIFNCNKYHDSNRQRCADHYITQEAIVGALKDLLDRQLELCVDMDPLMVKARGEDGGGASRGQLLALRDQRDELEARQFRYLEDLTEGILDRETYLRLKEKCQQELEMVAAREASVKRQQERRREAVSAAETWLSAVRRYQKLPVLDRGIVDALVEKILVFEDRSIRLCLTYADPIALFDVGADHAEGGALHAG